MFNTLLRAKVVYNKNKELYKIVAAFNVTETTERGEYRLPNKKDFTSSDFSYETFEADKQRIIAQMKRDCRTDNIEFV